MEMSVPIPGQPESNGEIESPGLGVRRGYGPAYELKFQLNEADAQAIELWARQNLRPDPHGDDGLYHVTTIYCDTPQLDVFHRSEGFRRNKYRLRRYGATPRIFLERKAKKGDRVRKKRVEVPEEELHFFLNGTPDPAWSARWFHQRIRDKGLLPTCGVAYWRTAFFGQSANGPIRMTFDRHLIGAGYDSWGVPNLREGQPLLPEAVLLEMKYHVHMPVLYRDLLPQLPPQPARVSKYRLSVQRCGIQASARPSPIFSLLQGPLSTNGGPHRDGQ
jgi:hypothetical protein